MTKNSSNLKLLTSNRQEHSHQKHSTYNMLHPQFLFHYFSPTTLFLFITFLFFCTGFIVFSEKIEQLKIPDSLPKADAIIVLTGGENRIETGLNLLQQKLGSRLLISGVNTVTTLDRLIHTTHINPQLFSCCVDIGHQATNTKENAKESSFWIKKHHYQTLYIVTHDYHMWRSLRELKHLMPNVNFIAYPVKKSENESTIQQINRVRIIAFEYIKTIGAHIRTAF
ncbi:YdcF family protein [Bartonella sp. B41]